MTNTERIINQFNSDEPILVEDIIRMFPNRSRQWVDKMLKTMVDTKTLKRYSTGVYYIPRNTIFGDSLLDSDRVVSKKYIESNGKVYGYVSGTALLNSLGLTTQVPNMITVVTNNEKSRGRKVKIGKQEVYLIKSPTEITEKNCAVLQLLEAVKLVDLNDLDETESQNLENYIRKKKITLNDVSKYCVFFPDVVSRKILGGKLIGKLAQ
ncbi:MAG: hypothetical protein J1E85_08480 [Ruminococcus sp.]|nr:hypothetical protein [Ruminococcus sp.]